MGILDCFSDWTNVLDPLVRGLEGEAETGVLVAGVGAATAAMIAAAS